MKLKKIFSVIDDIISFITIYEKKYKINISEDLNEIIENISNKVLELIFYNNPNFNDYEVDISMLNEDYNSSEYLNDFLPKMMN